MNPSLTCHIVRSVERCLSSERRTRNDGILERDFPAFGENFRTEYFLYNVSRKLRLDTNPELRKEKALEKFRETELTCKTKKASVLWDLDRYSARVIMRAQQIVSDTLGCVSQANWWKYCEFTSGASTSRRKAEASPAFKYDASIVPDVTPLALPYLLSWLAGADESYTCFLALRHLLNDGYTSDREPMPFYRVVPGARFNFVPKDWDVDRVTLQEPDWNMFLQKGCGTYIRKRLKACGGPDLNSQTRNQRLAFAGSLSGSLGTMDLSSASDTISQGFCRLLLPAEWFELFYALRSPTYELDGQWYTLEKMCSMGNGYTFELESLLFYALAKACVDVLRPSDSRVAVYGDDIIVASSVCGYLAEILRRVGFTLNRKKSYWGSTPFRESCGCHFIRGVDCSPVYVKEQLDDPIYLQQFINQLGRWIDFPYGSQQTIQLMHDLASRLPANYRNQIPVEEGDQGGLHYPELCVELVKHHRHFSKNEKRPNYGDVIQYFMWVEPTTDYTCRVNTWSQWVYFHMTGSVLLYGVAGNGRVKRVRKVVSTARGADASLYPAVP